MIRGGNWNNNARNCRSANRNNNNPSNRNNNIGFRVVLAPAQPARRRAHWLTRRPSRPARRDARRQTESTSRPVRVGEWNSPKAPGGKRFCFRVCWSLRMRHRVQASGGMLGDFEEVSRVVGVVLAFLASCGQIGVCPLNEVCVTLWP
ncbi:MAG: hypothetical protein ACLQM8_20480 [Limisphaerales bacterium]